jgi:NAD+ synthase (glutamine-hydrolysing)
MVPHTDRALTLHSWSTIKARRNLFRIGQYREKEDLGSAQELANRIFSTVYMGTENSSEATRSRAVCLAAEVGAYHVNTSIDSVVSAAVSLFSAITGML